MAAAPSRTTRDAGARMRSQLLDAAAAAFRERGPTAPLAPIAAAAGAFPSQITYYFGSKEGLFVEAACRELLHAATAAEGAAAAATDPDDYVRALAAGVAPSPALDLVVDALALVRRRRDLAPLVERTFATLHAEGARAYAGVRAVRGWPARTDPDGEARRFWTLALGVALRAAASPATAGERAAELLSLLRVSETKDRSR